MISVCYNYRCCSSRRVLKEGEVADNNDETVELEKVEKCFEDQLEDDPAYTTLLHEILATR